MVHLGDRFAWVASASLCASVLGCTGDVGNTPESSGGGDSAGGGDVSSSGGEASGAGGGAGGQGGEGGGLPDQDLVEVGHAREFRAAWVATVNNINFPSKPGLSAAAQKAELDKLVGTLEKYNLNAIVFQVRPESDALYASELEPWSRFLTGTQGKDPGYDPLAYLVEKAHVKNIEVHAWFNPYRAKVSASSEAVPPHPSVTLSKYAYPYGSTVWMDPGAEAVRAHVVEVIVDVVRRYDIDGVHFDDYFYPYPVEGASFPDESTYAAYQDSGGKLSRGDWRRQNVNRLVEQLGVAIEAEKPHVRWGISPFGIYRPGQPEGTAGLDQYAELFADPKKWIEEKWIDYVAPQLYWRTDQTQQAYGLLLPWWSELSAKHGRYMFAGNFLSKLGESGWTVGEFRKQIEIGREHRGELSMGNIFYQIAPLVSNKSGIGDVLKSEFYAEPALTPPLASAAGATLEPPFVTVDGEAVEVAPVTDEPLRALIVYAPEGDGFRVREIVPASKSSKQRIELGSGTFVVSAASMRGVESMGVRVEIP